jgi:putative SOS response-associated peptidase YedK
MRHGDDACVRAHTPDLQIQGARPRMPAILEDDAWSTWLGEDNETPEAAKAVLKKPWKG